MKIEVTEEHCKLVLQIFQQTNVKGDSAKKLVEVMEVYERALQETPKTIQKDDKQMSK